MYACLLVLLCIHPHYDEISSRIPSYLWYFREQRCIDVRSTCMLPVLRRIFVNNIFKCVLNDCEPCLKFMIIIAYTYQRAK